MAHNGVLFLDELPEFTRKTLEALRQPLEEGQVHLSRANVSVSYPSAVMLVCSMNPSAEGGGEICASYLKKISGPLLDRIDLHVEAPAVSYEKLSKTSPSESSAMIRQRVLATRQRQIKRFNGTSLACNAQMSGKEIEAYCALKKLVFGPFRASHESIGAFSKGLSSHYKSGPNHCRYGSKSRNQARAHGRSGAVSGIGSQNMNAD